MKSSMLNNKNSSNDASPPLETILKFETGLTRALMSGTKRVTIRFGKRNFAPLITIYGKRAEVQSVVHTQLLYAPFEVLQQQGFRHMFHALISLQKYYPGITQSSPITIVTFRILDTL